MLPADTYSAVVVPVSTDHGDLVAQFGKSKEKKTPQVAITFEVISGPYAGERISWFGYFTDKSTERTLESLRICGFVGDDVDKFNDQRPENEVHIVVKHETYEGNVSAKVAWINDPLRGGGVVIDHMDPKEFRGFAAQLKSKLRSFPAVEGRKAERQPRGAAPAAKAADGGGWHGNDDPDPPKDNPAADDDIPF